MFAALQTALAPHGIRCEAATEEFMGCGFGVCFGCTLKVKEDDGKVGYRLCCADGCIFPLDRLVFDGHGHGH
jgi:dihydroorotate dehydrogenase electron transfer subunit